MTLYRWKIVKWGLGLGLLCLMLGNPFTLHAQNKADKLEFNYVPPSKVPELRESLKALYGKHRIQLPYLADTLGWLQIRFISEENDIIFKLYQELPEKWGTPEKQEAVFRWHRAYVPDISPEKLNIEYIYYGVSSYLSGRGTYINTQLIWINLRDLKNVDLLNTRNSYYARLKTYFEELLQEEEKKEE